MPLAAIVEASLDELFAAELPAEQCATTAKVVSSGDQQPEGRHRRQLLRPKRSRQAGSAPA